jgi:hypothetical protein
MNNILEEMNEMYHQELTKLLEVVERRYKHDAPKDEMYDAISDFNARWTPSVVIKRVNAALFGQSW